MSKRDDVSLREYLEARLAAIDAATAKAERAQEAYNVAHNDLTRRIDASAATLLPRTEYTVQHEALKNMIENAREDVAQLRGTQRVLLLTIGAFVTVQLFTVGLLIQHIVGH